VIGKVAVIFLEVLDIGIAVIGIYPEALNGMF
jgi:hypothetical protein